MDLLVYFNPSFHPDDPIPSKEVLADYQELLVPVNTVIPGSVKSRSLVIKDITHFNIELKMMRLNSYPIFWIYYCTAGADVLGKLVLTPTEMVFEPLNSNLRGYVDYKGSRKSFSWKTRRYEHEHDHQLRRYLHPRNSKSHPTRFQERRCDFRYFGTLSNRQSVKYNYEDLMPTMKLEKKLT